MRLALFSDIHGNLQALDAVIQDARALGVDAHWALGDLAAIGPEPVAVLERLCSLDNLTVVRGNTDRYIVTGAVPPPSLEQAQANPALVSLFAEVTASFAWTRGFVTAAGWFDWLDALPLEARLTLPDGTRLLGVHAEPGTDEAEGLHPGRSNAELAALLANCDADLICAGHTHEPVLRSIEGIRAVNLGCVGNPTMPDLRASYVILDATELGSTIHHRRIAYDREAFIKSVQRSRHPSADFILSFQRGERKPRTAHGDHSVPKISSPEAA
jgi:predicted phosphodiesterase